MKTGILTYHNTRNSGAVLQAYALQKTLSDMGFDNDIIDYRCPEIERVYCLKRIWELKSIKEFVKWALTIRPAKRSQKKFDAFKRNYLKLSKPYFRDTISGANDSYDVFITGSDQVWNFDLNGNDRTYLLDFAKKGKKRLSYAASMGSTAVSGENEEIFARELLQFDGVSVRESSLKEYVDKACGVDGVQVLDPTLLLKKDDYDFEGGKSAVKGKYIFVYTIAATPNIEKVARDLSQKTGYPIIWGHMSYRKRRGVINKTDISPDEFIRYINNAEYVLTSSFHGMALSVVMEKQFFYDLDIKKKNNNSRLETLAAVLGLENRRIDTDSSDLQNEKKIDYAGTRAELEKLREKSLLFLKNNL